MDTANSLGPQPKGPSPEKHPPLLVFPCFSPAFRLLFCVSFCSDSFHLQEEKKKKQEERAAMQEQRKYDREIAKAFDRSSVHVTRRARGPEL